MSGTARKIRQPKYRHYKPKNLAVVRIDGKDHYLGEYDSKESWQKYHQLLADWQARQGLPPPPQPDQTGFVGVSVVVEGYLNFAKTYYRRDGQITREYGYLIYAFEPLLDLFGLSNANEFGPKSLKLYRQKLLTRKLARPVINSCVSRVKRMFKWATAEEIVQPSIYHGLFAVAGLAYGRSEARETEPVRPVSDEVVDATLPYLGSVVSAMVRVQRITGMRVCEVTIMRPCDIDQSSDVWVYQPSVHKNLWRGHVRQVPLGPKAQEILKPFMNRRPDCYLFSPAESEEERNALKRKNRKSPMTPSQAARKPKSKPGRAKRERYDTDSYRGAIDYALKMANKNRKPEEKIAAFSYRKPDEPRSSSVPPEHRSKPMTLTKAGKIITRDFSEAREKSARTEIHRLLAQGHLRGELKRKGGFLWYFDLRDIRAHWPGLLIEFEPRKPR